MPCRVVDGKVLEDGGEIEIVEDGQPVSPAVAMALAKQSGAMEKTATGLGGFDWILGGGFLRAKAISFAGPEGAGKTSFLAKLAISLERLQIRFMLCSSEQSPEDLVTQFARYGKPPSKYVQLVHETNRDRILDLLEKYRPDACAIDSVHDVDGVTDEDDNPLASGSSRAVHAVAKDIRKLSRDLGMFTLLVCHLNTDGSIKGGASLRHEVDGTLMLERPPEENDPTRILRFKKYRFAEPGRRAKFLMLDNDFKDCGAMPANESKHETTQEQPAAKKTALRLVDDDFNDGA